MKDSPKPSPAQRTRRFVLGWGGTGLLTAIAGYFGWRIAQREPFTPSAPAAGPRLVNSNGEPLPAPEPISEPPPTTPTRDGFAKHLGTDFQIDVGGYTRPCKLTNVSEGRTLHGKGVTYAAYSILFEPRAAFAFESRTYRVEHPAMGTMELFLAQIGDPKQGTKLEAVFSERI